MATVNAGGVALDMTHLQLATLQNAPDSIYDVGHVRVDDGANHFDDVVGSGFAYASTGDYYDYYGGGSAMGPANQYDPTGGTITGVMEMSNGVVTMDVSNLSLAATSVFAAVRAGDSATLMSSLFGGDDQINGGADADSLDGLGGNDTISGAAGGDSIRGFEGNDSIDGGAGADDLNGNVGDDTVHGGDDADFVRGGQGGDVVFGDTGADVVNGNIGADTVDGGDGNDTVFGGQGNDLVQGGSGNDQISGDLGDDTLTGGAGADIFLFRQGSGHDTITDFNAGEGDRIMLPTGTTFTTASAGADTVITLSDGAQLTVSGVALADFNSGWVVFG